MKSIILSILLLLSTNSFADSTANMPTITSSNDFAPAISNPNQSCNFKGVIKSTILGEPRFCNSAMQWSNTTSSNIFKPLMNKASSRALNTIYTNNSGYSRIISIAVGLGATTAYGNLYVDGVLVSRVGKAGANGDNYHIFYIVPNGSNYKLTGAIGIAAWFEN